MDHESTQSPLVRRGRAVVALVIAVHLLIVLFVVANRILTQPDGDAARHVLKLVGKCFLAYGLWIGSRFVYWFYLFGATLTVALGAYVLAVKPDMMPPAFAAMLVVVGLGVAAALATPAARAYTLWRRARKPSDK